MHKQPPWTNEVDEPCYAGVLQRYMNKLGPGQERLFFKPATPNQQAKYSLVGYPNIMMSPSQPMGIHSIERLFKKSAVLLDLDEPEKYSGHSLRRIFCTMLYNNPEVRIQEAMTASHHNSMCTSMTSIERYKATEENRMKDFGSRVNHTPKTHMIPMLDLQKVTDDEDAMPIVMFYMYQQFKKKYDKFSSKDTRTVPPIRSSLWTLSVPIISGWL